MVYVFLATGFEEVEALTAVDLLRRADIQVKTVSIMEDKLVYGSHGIGVEADILFKEGLYDRCAMLILPGGMPGTINLCNHGELNEELKLFYEAGKPIAAICAAPMVLGRAGLLSGHEATIYDGMEEELAGAVVRCFKKYHYLQGTRHGDGFCSFAGCLSERCGSCEGNFCGAFVQVIEVRDEL